MAASTSAAITSSITASFTFLERFGFFSATTFTGFAVNLSIASSGVPTGLASMKPSGWNSLIRASPSVPANARTAASPRSASSITQCRTSATEIGWPRACPEPVEGSGPSDLGFDAATAIASSTSDSFTPIRISPSISFSRYFASSALTRRSNPSTSPARTAVVRAEAIPANASSTPLSGTPGDNLGAPSFPASSDKVGCSSLPPPAATIKSKAAAPRSPCRR